MTVTDVDTQVDAKAGYSSMCRRGDHGICATAKAKCTCECHGAARRFLQDNRAATGAPPAAAVRPARKAAPARPPATPPPPPPSLVRRSGGGPGAKPPPHFELVKADPPAQPDKKQYRKTIAEQVRPLLEEVLVSGERCWFRIVLFHTANQASFNVGRLRKAYGPGEWEFRAAHLDEVDQSAMYVRWTGTASVML